MNHMEAIAVAELVKATLIKQMASGVGTGLLAEGRLQQPALQIRRIDSDG